MSTQANSPDGVSTGPLTYIGDIYQVKISTKTNDNPVATFGGAKGRAGCRLQLGPRRDADHLRQGHPRAG